MEFLDFSNKNVIALMLLSAAVGFIIPSFSRRFAKLMPCVPPNMIIELLRVPRYMLFPKRSDAGDDNIKRAMRNAYMLRLRSKLFWGSFMMAILMMALSLVMLSQLPQPSVFWLMGFMLVSFLLAVIDVRYELLPDVLTIPLLISGFAFALWGAGEWMTFQQSVLGAIAGYLMPTFVGVLMYWRNNYAFGGGDFKMLAAVGAWIGIERLNLAILVSVFFFVLFALFRKKKQGPYGLAIALGSMVALLLPLDTIFSLYNSLDIRW